jgi:hypothetical protein
MTAEEKLVVALEALKRIATFGHVDGCMSSAPVHECGCYPKDEKEIALEALDALGE